jgi:antitoxin component of MazEF toxin-antitoxin module
MTVKTRPKFPVGTVIKVRGDEVTVQLSNNRTITLAPNTRWNLAVGYRVRDDIVQAFDSAMPQLI